MANVVGSGNFRYELVPSWPKMPKYWGFGAASDAAVNSLDEVHIFSRSDHPLTIWDSDGNFLSSWCEGTFSGNEHGIFIAPNDRVWLVDAWFHIATEHTPDGKVLRTLGKKLGPSTRIAGRPFNQPTGLAIAPDGDLFVSDGYGGHPHRFNADGELLKSWGSRAPVRASSPCCTTSGSTETAAYSSATARTTASGYSTPKAPSWSSGRT